MEVDGQAELWRRALQLFEQLDELEPGRRLARVEQIEQSEARLGQLLRGLIDADEDDGPTLERPAVGPGATRGAADSALAVGAALGPYRLVSRIGEGGMGEVWEAEQTQPVRRRVAIKVIREGLGSEEVVERFHNERQAMALMSHPNIAAVFDAAATDDGRPYFVMERVHGEPITRFCDRRRLDLPSRLALFQQVCAAVQHAHHKGLVHRDLKASNILVAAGGPGEDPESEGEWIPKVIDFGIAKAFAGPMAELASRTEQGRLVGTPEAMSPEQAEGRAAGPIPAECLSKKSNRGSRDDLTTCWRSTPRSTSWRRSIRGGRRSSSCAISAAWRSRRSPRCSTSARRRSIANGEPRGHSCVCD